MEKVLIAIANHTRVSVIPIHDRTSVRQSGTDAFPVTTTVSFASDAAARSSEAERARASSSVRKLWKGDHTDTRDEGRGMETRMRMSRANDGRRVAQAIRAQVVERSKMLVGEHTSVIVCVYNKT